MNTANTTTNRDEWSAITARVNHLLGSNSKPVGSFAATTLNSRRQPTPRRGKHAQQSQTSPRSWNETLAFAADG